MMYTGTYTARADAKWRLFFPADLRRRAEICELPHRYILKKDVYADCLTIYPFSAWENEVATLRAKLNRWDARQAMMFRRFMSDVAELTLDANGRFSVPKNFQLLFTDDRKVVFLGVDDRIELWSADKYAEAMLPADDFMNDLANLMK